MEKKEIICRCEEITREDILEAIKDGRTTISGIKRYTRAGMGACQGRTCSKLIMRILMEEGIIDEIKPDTPRFPLVPIKIEELGEEENE